MILLQVYRSGTTRSVFISACTKIDQRSISQSMVFINCLLTSLLWLHVLFAHWIVVLLPVVFKFTTHILKSIEYLIFKVLLIEDLHYTTYSCTRWNGDGVESMSQVTSELFNLCLITYLCRVKLCAGNLVIMSKFLNLILAKIVHLYKR